MLSRSYLVEGYAIDTTGGKVLWNGEEKEITGQLSCFGEGHNFTVYFVPEGKKVPLGGHDPERKQSTIFIPQSEMNNYMALKNVAEPVYAYYNINKPQLNCLTVSEPVREYMY